MLKELQQWENLGQIELFYFDESGFSQTSMIPYAWGPKGETLELPAYSHSRRLNVLGFLSRQGKLIHHETTGKVTTDTVIEAFDRLITGRCKEKFSVVVMDNAQIHKSAQFKRKQVDWMEQGIFVVYLPPYSPELNPIEILWRKIKYSWLPVTAYQTFETLCENVRRLLAGYGSENRIIFV